MLENNPARACYRLMEVYETTPKNVAKQHYKAEGFVSQKSCFEHLKEMFGGELPERVYLHWFARISNSWLHETQTNKQIIVKFTTEMKQKILSGNKFCTSRDKRLGEIGDWFVVEI